MRIAALALIAALVALPRVALAGDGKDLFPLVGDGARMVAVIDVAHVRDASAFQKLEKLAVSQVDALAKLAAAGIDLSKLDTVLLAEDKGSSTPSIMVATGSFTSAEIDGYATALGDVADKHAGVSYWKGSNHELAMIGKKVVMTPAGGMAAVIDRTKKKGHTLPRSSKSAALRKAIAMTDTRYDIWTASADDLLNTGAKMKAISIGMSLSSDVVLQVKMDMSDADAAKDLADKAGKQLDQIKSFLQQGGLTGLASSLAVDVDDDVVQLGATLPGGELDTFLALVGRFL